MSFVVDLAVAFVAGVLLVLLSTVKTAYGQMSDVSRHILRAGRSDRGAFFGELFEREARFRTSLLLGIHTCVVALSVISVHTAQKFGHGHSYLMGFLLATVIVALCRVVIPTLVAQNAPDRVLLALAPVFKPYYRATAVVAGPISAFFASFRKDEPDAAEGDEDEAPDETMSDIQAFIDVAEEEGIIEESEGALIQSIVDLGDTQVREVMTPRTQVVALPNTASLLDARDLMVASKHSRLPVFSEQIDNVEGVVYVRDVLGGWAEGRESEPASSAMRPAYFVPEVKAVGDLLEEMRKSKMQIALVIDEYGALAGLVTIEDLIEEIVGEIEDEDMDISGGDEIVEEPDGAIVVKGATEIRKVEVRLARELEADDFTTVAGLIINELGHLPSRGERLAFKGLDFEVLEADSRRVHLVRLRESAEEPAAEPAPETARQGAKRDE